MIAKIKKQSEFVGIDSDGEETRFRMVTMTPEIMKPNLFGIISPWTFITPTMMFRFSPSELRALADLLEHQQKA